MQAPGAGAAGFVERDEFATITKIGTGLSDAGWREMYERAQALMVEQRPAHVSSILVPDVWLRPQVVVVVLADEITPSPRHTCGKVGDQPGLALRFPRIVSFRGEDKQPEHTTTVNKILEMHRQQRPRPVRAESPTAMRVDAGGQGDGAEADDRRRVSAGPWVTWHAAAVSLSSCCWAGQRTRPPGARARSC